MLERAERTRFTTRTLVELDELSRELARTARRGYAVDNEEYEKGLRCVASPIRDRNRRPTYAVSVSGVAPRMAARTTREIGLEVATAASAIETSLGYVGQDSVDPR
jgi:DNA-binding IclR family transcriptional regulator